MSRVHDGEGFEEEGASSGEIGDPTAQVSCPYCGAWVEIILDTGGAARQQYVEDCQVCCQPWHLTVHWDASGNASVEARSEDE